MSTHDLVYKVLKENPESRNSDKLLYWHVLQEKGLIIESGEGNAITFINYMKAPKFETITRTARCIKQRQNERILKAKEELDNKLLRKKSRLFDKIRIRLNLRIKKWIKKKDEFILKTGWRKTKSV